MRRAIGVHARVHLARRRGHQRRTLPPGSVELGGALAACGLELLKVGTLEAAREAEPLLQECLEIRAKAIPDDWRVPNTRSLLGAALLGQNKLAEAEPLLLDGYKEIQEREAAIPPQGKMRIPETLERLVRLYEAKGNQTEAAAWRRELEAIRAEHVKAEGKP
jgi:hypothetical protein